MCILLELEPTLNPTSIMIDFEKAAMDSLENNFNASTSGCFFHLAQSELYPTPLLVPLPDPIKLGIPGHMIYKNGHKLDKI